MAQVVDDFDFDAHKANQSDYPWDQWLNGQTWKLKAGVDFSVPLRNFTSAAYAAGKRRQLEVQCATDTTTNVVYLRAAKAVKVKKS